MPEGTPDIIEATLPLSGTKVGLRVLKQIDLDAVREKVRTLSHGKTAKAGEIEFVELLAKKIYSIDGNPATPSQANTFVNGLKAKDRAYIDYMFSKLELGYHDSVTVECPSCGEMVEVPFILNTEFFRPRFD